MPPRSTLGWTALLLLILLPDMLQAADLQPVNAWPNSSEVSEVLFLKNFNTRLVVKSTILLGIASGLVGSFLLLRKRSLMSDTLSHACLPGIAIMFLVMTAGGGNGKYLPGLLFGASVTGLLGMGMVLAIRKTTRIKDDTAMGIVLSVFFGGGIALLGIIQSMPGASAAGLESFIYGKTASMVEHDAHLIALVAMIVAVAVLLFLKEMTLVCFDDDFAASQGWPVFLIDALMLILVALVTVVGLQAVGLILIIAFLITPAAAARFWTDRFKVMLLLSGLIGGFSGWLGASVSALFPKLPAGALIVLAAAAIFMFSMVFGSARGVLRRVWQQRRLRIKIGRQHLLRAIFELIETHHAQDHSPVINEPVPFPALLDKRSWNTRRLRRLIRRAMRDDLLESFDGHQVRLSESGFGKAARMTRNHRLWELYLIRHADVAPGHVDRDADAVEHVLSADMVQQLESELLKRGELTLVPASPHALPKVEVPL